MSSTAYKIFVMTASEAGQKLEIDCGEYGWNEIEFDYSKIAWDWWKQNYRIKLPSGWEYPLEEGEIAFRIPTYDDIFLDSEYNPMQKMMHQDLSKAPIIKRIKE